MKLTRREALGSTLSTLVGALLAKLTFSSPKPEPRPLAPRLEPHPLTGSKLPAFARPVYLSTTTCLIGPSVGCRLYDLTVDGEPVRVDPRVL